jgi:hypothetical protein
LRVFPVVVVSMISYCPFAASVAGSVLSATYEYFSLAMMVPGHPEGNPTCPDERLPAAARGAAAICAAASVAKASSVAWANSTGPSGV